MDGHHHPVGATPAASAPGEVLTYFWRRSWGWLVLAVLLLLQYGLFRQYALREVTWSYPSSGDQIVYLMMSYDTYEHILSQGLLKGLHYGLDLKIANGMLIHLQASLLFLLMGASRLTALTLNYGYFALLQVVLAWTVYWLSGRWSIALLGVGILLTALTPFYIAGGLMDFRIDFIAFCQFGVFLCLVLRSRVFLSRRWALAAGAAAAWLVLFRFLTIVYLAGIFSVFFGYVCVRLWRRRRDPEARQLERRRLTGLILAGTVLAVVTGPILWDHRRAIIGYYVVGHLTGEEKYIRAQIEGADNPYGYYPHSLLVDHAGQTFLALSLLALGAALLLWWTRRAGAAQTRTGGVLDAGPAYGFLGISLVMPLLVLTANISRSPIVANIAVTPLLWLVLLTVLAGAGLHRLTSRHPLLDYSLAGLAAVALAGGTWQQFAQYGRQTGYSVCRADVEHVLELYDLVGHWCREGNWYRPFVSVNVNSDHLHANVGSVVLYERHRLWCEFLPGLGREIFATTEAAALQLAHDSQFLILRRPVSHQTALFPFDHSMVAITPRLLALADRHFTPLRTFRIYGHDVTLYVRPQLAVLGATEGWITSDGLTVRCDGTFLQKSAQIRIWGRTDFSLLDRMPALSAQLSVPGRAPRRIPAKLQAHGSAYTLVLDLKDSNVPAGVPATIHLAFDSYFVPRDHGPKAGRRLVMRAPAGATVVYP